MHRWIICWIAATLPACSGCSDVQIVGDAGIDADAAPDSPGDWMADPDLADGPEVEALTWSRTYGTADEDSALAMIESRDGGYVVAGSLRDEEAWEADAWVLRLEVNGDPVWQKAYAWDARERLSAVAEMASGNLAVVGGASVDMTTGRAGIVAMLDRDGEPRWGVGFRPTAGIDPDIMVDGLHGLAALDDGGVAIAGTASGAILVARLDAGGTVVWKRLFSGSEPGSWYAPTVTMTPDGGLAIAARGMDAIERSYLLARLEPGGDLEWSRAYAGGGASSLVAGPVNVLCGPGGSYFLASEYTMGSGYSGFLGISLDAEGRPVWARSYTSDSWDTCAALATGPAHGGGWLLTGYWRGADAWILRIGEDGGVGWSLRYHEDGGPYYRRDEMRAIGAASDGGIFAAGMTESFGAVGGDLWALKMDATGLVRGDCPPGLGIEPDILPVDIDIPYMDAGLVASDPPLEPVPVVLVATPTDATGATQCSG